MSLEDILAGLNDSEPETRQETIRELVRRREFDTLPILRQVAARDPDADVRMLAAGAVDFFEREPAGNRHKNRRLDAETPHLSDEALQQKEIEVSKSAISPGEFITLGVIVALILGLLILVGVNAASQAIQEGVESNAPLDSREALVANMRQAIDMAREVAQQIQQIPTLIAETGAFDCATLTDIRAVYYLDETTRKTYPEFAATAATINTAYNLVNDAEEWWRRYCDESGGRLTEAPDYLISRNRENLQIGLTKLDKAANDLDQIAPPTESAP